MVNRTDANDVQAEAAQSGKEGSQAISQKDKGKFNKKTKKTITPKQPTPVIGCVLGSQLVSTPEPRKAADQCSQG